MSQVQFFSIRLFSQAHNRIYFYSTQLSLLLLFLIMYAAPPPPAWGSGDGGGNGSSYAIDQQPSYGGGGAAAAGGLQSDEDDGAAIERQLAIALGDAAANASRLASTPASDEPAARRLTVAVQMSLAAARASMRDLELFAEEQDT